MDTVLLFILYGTMFSQFHNTIYLLGNEIEDSEGRKVHSKPRSENVNAPRQDLYNTSNETLIKIRIFVGRMQRGTDRVSRKISPFFNSAKLKSLVSRTKNENCEY